MSFWLATFTQYRAGAADKLPFDHVEPLFMNRIPTGFVYFGVSLGFVLTCLHTYDGTENTWNELVGIWKGLLELAVRLVLSVFYFRWEFIVRLVAVGGLDWIGMDGVE